MSKTNRSSGQSGPVSITKMPLTLPPLTRYSRRVRFVEFSPSPRGANACSRPARQGRLICFFESIFYPIFLPPFHFDSNDGAIDPSMTSPILPRT
jgi:hypothetical protein